MVRFQWNGSTWTTDANTAPSYPIDLRTDTEAQIQRNFSGTARESYRWAKATIGLRWDDAGTIAPQVYIKNMITSNGTVNIAYEDGTYNCRPVPGSLSCATTGYYIYQIAATFTEI